MDAIHIEKLRLLINDPIVREQLTVDGVTAGKVRIKENGDIVLGRSSNGWVNFLFNSNYRISFFELSIKIAKIYIGTINNEGLVGFLKELCENKIKRDNREEIVDLLLMYAMLFVKNSILKSQYIKDNDLDEYPKDPRLRRFKLGGKATAFVKLGGQDFPISFDIIEDA